MNVLYVVGGFPSLEQPYRGVFNFRAVQSLSSIVDICVVFIRAWKPGRHLRSNYEYQGINVNELSLPILPGMNFINKAVQAWGGQILLRDKIRWANVIHSVDIAGTGIPVANWANAYGVPHVTQAIGSDLNTVFPLMKWPMISWVHGIVCNSLALEQIARSHWKDRVKYRTIYRGVDLDRFNPDQAGDRTSHINRNVQFLYMGGFTPYKNLKYGRNTKGGLTLLEAWKTKEKELIECHATLLLAGPHSDDAIVKKWRSGLANPDNVLIKGPIPAHKVPCLMGRVDVVVIPSLEEGLPNVAMEAAASGKAILGSNIGGVPEILHDQVNGILLKAGDVTELGDALIRLAGNIDTVDAYGRCSRNIATKYFDCKNYGDRIVSFYREVIGEG